MAKEARCADILHDCDYVARGDDEEQVMEDVAKHVLDVHDIKTISPELARRVRAAVHDSRPTLQLH